MRERERGRDVPACTPLVQLPKRHHTSPLTAIIPSRLGHLASVTSIPAAVRMRVWVVERLALDDAERAKTALSPSARSARLSQAFYDVGEAPSVLYLHPHFPASYAGRSVSFRVSWIEGRRGEGI